MYCVFCGKQIADDDAFCPYCGMPASQPMSAATTTKVPQVADTVGVAAGIEVARGA